MKAISNTELFHTQASRLKALSIHLSSIRFLEEGNWLAQRSSEAGRDGLSFFLMNKEA